MAVTSSAAHRLLSLLLAIAVHAGRGQEAPRRVVRQGVLTGVKLFTDGRVSVNAYLGIPYAAPPLGHLRFAPPERHPGWNGSLFAGAFSSPCPQPRPEALTEDPDGPVSMQLTGEDCLYLNVWTPDNSNSAGGVRGPPPPPGRLLPVMVFLEGEAFVHGSPARFPAMQELSARGVVVVSVSYRLNVFGFLCFGEPVARGNLGLLDQYVALRWVQENALAFGGDPGRVALVGHSAGAASAFFHLYSPRTKGLFQGAVLMSGSGLAPWALSGRDFSSSSARGEGAGAKGGAGAAILASVSIARSLGCAPHNLPDGLASPGPTASREMLACLRAKTTEELVRAFHTQLKLGNGSAALVPVADGAFLPLSEQYFPRDPLPCVLRDEEDAARGGGGGGRRRPGPHPQPRRPPPIPAADWTTADWAADSCDKAFSKLDIPVVTGVASHDGVVNLYGRGESLAREGYNQLRSFFESTAIPWAVRQYGVRQDAAGAAGAATTLPLVVQEALRFEYVDRSPDGDTEALLSQLIEFYTDSQFRAPHERQLRFLSKMSTRPVYAYVLEGTSHGGGFGSGGVPGSAPKGTAVNVTGAGHGSDLVLLFGSLAMLRASGRRFSASEERLSDAIQRLWLEFMRQGNPTLNAYGYDPVWRPYGGEGSTSPSRAFMALERQQMRAPSASGHSSGTGHDLGRRMALWNSFLPRLARTLHDAGPGGPQGSKAHDGSSDEEDGGDPSEPFRSLTFVLSGVCAMLLASLLLCFACLRRRRSASSSSSSAADPLGDGGGDLDDVDALAAAAVVASSPNLVSVVARGGGGQGRRAAGPRRCLPPGPAAASLASLNSLSSSAAKYSGSSGAWRYNLSANQL